MNIITDPWFYVTAIPATILMGLGKSGFGGGLGGLAVPLMALTVTVPQAAAVMMPLLLVADLIGLKVFKNDYDKSILKFMIPFGMVGIVIGTLLFKLLSAKAVAGCVGVFTLLFLAQHFIFKPKSDAKPLPKWLGGLLVATSGFTSFIAHAGGPPMNAFALPLKLKPLVFAATISYFFFFINLAKWIPYAYLGLLDLRNLWTSLVLIPFVGAGVWIGQKIAKRINTVLFYRLIYLGMFLSGTKLLWDGLS